MLFLFQVAQLLPSLCPLSLLPQLLLLLLLQVVVAAVVVAVVQAVAAASVLARLADFTLTPATQTNSITATMARPMRSTAPLAWSLMLAALAATGLKSKFIHLSAFRLLS